MAWLALPALKKSGLWSLAMPNALNFGFSYYWACVLTMLVYIPGARFAVCVHVCMYGRAFCMRRVCISACGLSAARSVFLARSLPAPIGLFTTNTHQHTNNATTKHNANAGLPQLYGYMLANRAKNLKAGGAAPKKGGAKRAKAA